MIGIRSLTQIHGDASRASYSAYVTYRREADALEAIRAVDGETLDGRIVRCTFGTTKYCSMFLRALPCNNSAVRREGGEMLNCVFACVDCIVNEFFPPFKTDVSQMRSDLSA